MTYVNIHTIHSFDRSASTALISTPGSCAVQDELAAIAAKHEKVSVSEAQARQQLAAAVQECERGQASGRGQQEEVRSLSLALQCSQAQLAEAAEKDTQAGTLLHALCAVSVCAADQPEACQAGC